MFAVAFVGCGGGGGSDGGVDVDDGGTDTGGPDTSDASDADATDAPACIELEAVDAASPGSDDAGVDAAVDLADVWTVDPSAVTEDGTGFPLGVQAGAMTTHSAVLWTQIADDETKTVAVWRESPTSEGELLLATTSEATGDENGYVHVLVDDLAPFTVYRYAFFSGSEDPGYTGRSAIGRFRTAPPEGSTPIVRVGATTCTGAQEDPTALEDALPFPALSLMAQDELDALLHVGDFSYNDGDLTIEDYRASWAETLGVQGYRDILASTGIYATWDDHEVADNYDPEMEDPARLEAAATAYHENVALGRADDHLWTSYVWGDTVEFIVTDLRGERLPSTRTSDSPVLISEEQMTFIEDRLLNSTAHFKVVFSSVNMSNLPGVWDIPLAYEDRWEGYGAQRDRVLEFIVDNSIENVWFLAGDLHVGFITRIETSGPYSNLWEITVGPGGSAPNPVRDLIAGGLLVHDDVYPCDQFLFEHTRISATTTLEFDPTLDAIFVRYVDGFTEEVLFEDYLHQ